MITHSGIHIQNIGGAIGTPTSSDIAVQSARLTRFVGAVWAPLIQHLIFVAAMTWNRSNGHSRTFNTAWAALHDANEVVTQDIPRPFKCECMRLEQRAIDTRLMDAYLGEEQRYVDFDLIKLVDMDSCDIEAVQLGIKNYSELAVANAQSYRGAVIDKPYDNPDDIRLFWKIRSDFGSINPVTASAERPVQRFTTLLELAKRRDWSTFDRYFKSWGYTN